MEKLRLELETITVESFPTERADGRAAGTVQAAAEAATFLTRCGSCWGVTCWATCIGSPGCAG